MCSNSILYVLLDFLIGTALWFGIERAFTSWTPAAYEGTNSDDDEELLSIYDGQPQWVDAKGDWVQNFSGSWFLCGSRPRGHWEESG